MINLTTNTVITSTTSGGDNVVFTNTHRPMAQALRAMFSLANQHDRNLRALLAQGAPAVVVQGMMVGHPSTQPLTHPPTHPFNQLTHFTN